MSIQSIGQNVIPYDPNLAENNQTVYEVQHALTSLGFSVPQNGVFNSQTEQALLRFQQTHHLDNSGIIDQPTIDALNRQVEQRQSSQGSHTMDARPPLTGAERNRRTQELRLEALAREGELRGRPLGEQNATAAPSGREQVLRALRSETSPQQAQLQHSITQAGQLVENPRGGEENWEDRRADARVQMRSVAEAFERDGGAASYQRLPQHQREQVWRNFLMTDQVDTAQDVMRSLRSQDPQVAQQAFQDLRNADASLRDIPRAQFNAPTHGAADILQGLDQPTRQERAAEVERSAAVAGDPRPNQPNPQDVNLFMRLTQRAYTRADLAAYTDEARRPGLHAFMAFMGAFPTDPSPGGMARNAAESALTEAHPHMEGPFFALSVLENLATAEETYRNFATPEGRFRHALQEAALDEAGGDEIRGRQILAQLSQTGQQLDGNLRWLQRHPEHPGAPPAQDSFEQGH